MFVRRAFGLRPHPPPQPRRRRYARRIAAKRAVERLFGFKPLPAALRARSAFARTILTGYEGKVLSMPASQQLRLPVRMDVKRNVVAFLCMLPLVRQLKVFVYANSRLRRHIEGGGDEVELDVAEFTDVTLVQFACSVLKPCELLKASKPVL